MNISGNARLAGVMGWPIAHSLSPRIHNYWLRELGIDGAYVPLAVAPENLADALSALPKLGFTGVNITIPHKQAALAAMDHVDDLARRIGAVNTVTVGDDGALNGANTDGFGFMENLRDHAPDLDLGGDAVVVFGAGGTDSQHAFFQLLHQGTDVVPVDLIGVARPVTDPRGAHHDGLMANLLAQAESLAFGRTDTEAAALGVAPDLVAHQEFPGNRPSTVVLLPELSPSTLGQLVALYEHRTVVQAAVWGINPFDQWGVELGKQLTTRFHDRLTGGADTGREEPSSGLIRRYRGLRGRD